MDNPSFFPLNTVNDGTPGAFAPEPGISLRDWFAGQAMAAIIAKIPFEEFPADWSPYNKTAIGAYDYADAMLAARTNRGQSNG